MNLDTLPTIAGHTWRSLTPNDATALCQFELACSSLDGATNLTSEDEWVEKLGSTALESVAAFSDKGAIIAAAIVENNPGADSERVFLEGRVHPDFRGQGTGSALLSWMEAQATTQLRTTASERPKVLRIMFWDRPDDAVALFKQHGFEFLYVEEEMRVDLHEPRPDLSLPGDFLVEFWSPENAPAFYAVYEDAFSTRTGNLLNEADWSRFWANPDDPEFRPHLSFLVWEQEKPVAFCVGHEYEAGEAYVGQFGVRPAWRRKGIGAAVLAEALDRFAAAGYRYGVLNVNIDNPNARRLYERAGFKLSKRLTMYHKVIENEPAD